MSKPKLSDLHTVVHNAIVLAVRESSLWALNGILVLFLPRYLGDAGLGQLQFALSFVALFGIGMGLGSRQFLLKEIARDHSQIGKYIGAALGIRFIMAAAILALIALTLWLTRPSAEAAAVVMLAAVAMIITSFSDIIRAAFHGLEDMAKPALAEVAQKLAVVGLGITALALGYGILIYAVVLVVGSTIQLAINYWNLQKIGLWRINFDQEKMKALLVGGAPFLFMAALLIAYSHGVVILLRVFTEDAVVGWYAAASGLYQSGQVFALLLTTALLPTLSRTNFANMEAAVSIARKSTTALLVVVVPVAFAMSVLSGKIIDLLNYPAAFENSVPMLTILALSIPVTSFLTLLGTIAIASDRQKVWSIALLGTVLLNLTINAIAIPYFQNTSGNGAIGAALALLVTECSMVAVGIRLIPRGVLNASTAFTSIKIIIAGAGMALTGIWTDNEGLRVQLPLMASVYLALVLGLRVIEVKDLRSMAKHLMAYSGIHKGFKAPEGEVAHETL